MNDRPSSGFEQVARALDAKNFLRPETLAFVTLVTSYVAGGILLIEADFAVPIGWFVLCFSLLCGATAVGFFGKKIKWFFPFIVTRCLMFALVFTFTTCAIYKHVSEAVKNEQRKQWIAAEFEEPQVSLLDALFPSAIAESPPFRVFVDRGGDYVVKSSTTIEEWRLSPSAANALYDYMRRERRRPPPKGIRF